MAIDEKLKVDSFQPAEQPTPGSGDSTTTIDAEVAVQTEGGEDVTKGQQGVRKHLIALSIVLCQLVVVCGRSDYLCAASHLNRQINT
jgi:hypothetical protein